MAPAPSGFPPAVPWVHLSNKPYRSFEILNLGKYERQYFVGIDHTLPEKERAALSVAELPHTQGPCAGIGSAPYEYKQKGKYKIAVKVIDIFGNDTTKVVEVSV